MNENGVMKNSIKRLFSAINCFKSKVDVNYQIHFTAKIKNMKIERNVFWSKNVSLSDCDIGNCTAICDHTELSNVKVGKYSSIAYRVKNYRAIPKWNICFDISCVLFIKKTSRFYIC